jgi:hypothetical protein
LYVLPLFSTEENFDFDSVGVESLIHNKIMLSLLTKCVCFI